MGKCQFLWEIVNFYGKMTILRENRLFLWENVNFTGKSTIFAVLESQHRKISESEQVLVSQSHKILVSEPILVSQFLKIPGKKSHFGTYS